MARRLNDTAAIVDSPYTSEQSHSVRVRKIDNGYVTHTSSMGPNGDYRCAEMYTKEPPRLTVPEVRGRARPGSESLEDAVKYMGGGELMPKG